MSTHKRRRRIETETSKGIDSGQMLNLSLFIMLLAFFIVLNSLSTYEELKTEKVRRSIDMAFSNKPQTESTLASLTPDPAQGLREGHTFDRLDALFKTQITSYEVVKSKTTGVMMVQLPYEEFERAVMAVGQKNLLHYPTRREVHANFFLPTLASLLRTNIDGTPTRMEILLNIEENPAEFQNKKPREMGRIIGKAGALSRQLEKQGVPEKLINIGVQKGDPKMVDLIFRKYVPFSPVKDKKEGNGQE